MKKGKKKDLKRFVYDEDSDIILTKKSKPEKGDKVKKALKSLINHTSK